MPRPLFATRICRRSGPRMGCPSNARVSIACPVGGHEAISWMGGRAVHELLRGDAAPCCPDERHACWYLCAPQPPHPLPVCRPASRLLAARSVHRREPSGSAALTPRGRPLVSPLLAFLSARADGPAPVSWTPLARARLHDMRCRRRPPGRQSRAQKTPRRKGAQTTKSTGGELGAQRQGGVRCHMRRRSPAARGTAAPTLRRVEVGSTCFMPCGKMTRSRRSEERSSCVR